MIKVFKLMLIQLVVLYGCQNGYSPKYECIQEFSTHLYNIDTGEIVNFKKIDCFSWDSLLIIAPAFGEKRVEKYSRIELPPGVNYNYREDGEGSKWFILFIKNNEVMDYFTIKRVDLDFSLLKRNQVETAEDFFFLPKKRTQFSTYSNGVSFVDSDEEVVWAKFKP